MAGGEVKAAQDADDANERARELARRVMNLPPKPRIKPKAEPKEDRESASKRGKSEPTGEAS